MLLGVFAHIEAHQFDTHLLCQHAGHLSLSHSRRAYEEQRCYGLLLVQQPRFGHLHGLYHLSYGLVLPVYLFQQARFECLQCGVVVVLFDGQCVDFARLGQQF